MIINTKHVMVFLLLLFTYQIQGEEKMHTFYDFTALSIKGQNISMSDYKGKVILVVNVASKCGYTPQYEGLQKLYTQYKSQGLEILGFPCNQFREQEPANNTEIQTFCKLNYGVTFPLFEKIEVNGNGTHPLYTFLKKEATGFLGTESIKWNFTKFLIDAKGNVLKRYGSSTKPKALEKDIKVLLQM